MDPPHINHQLLVINSTGSIRQLFVPFRVQVLYNTNTLHKDCWVWVEEVMQHEQYVLLYRVTEYWWPYYLFRIQVSF